MKDNKQPCENISFLVRCGLLSSLMLLGTGVPSEPLAAGFIVPEAVTQPIKECAGPRFNTLACARGIEKTHLAKKTCRDACERYLEDPISQTDCESHRRDHQEWRQIDHL